MVKVGDRVRMCEKGGSPSDRSMNGQVGTVTKESSRADMARVRFDGPVSARMNEHTSSDGSLVYKCNLIKEENKVANKKLNEKTVRAVGGCQYDALVALLKEMGHEVLAQPVGVRVRAGQRVTLAAIPGSEYTVAPSGTFKFQREGAISLWDRKGTVCWAMVDTVLLLDSKEQVIEYEK